MSAPPHSECPGSISSPKALTEPRQRHPIFSSANPLTFFLTIKIGLDSKERRQSLKPLSHSSLYPKLYSTTSLPAPLPPQAGQGHWGQHTAVPACSSFLHRWLLQHSLPLPEHTSLGIKPLLTQALPHRTESMLEHPLFIPTRFSQVLFPHSSQPEGWNPNRRT